MLAVLIPLTPRRVRHRFWVDPPIAPTPFTCRGVVQRFEPPLFHHFDFRPLESRDTNSPGMCPPARAVEVWCAVLARVGLALAADTAQTVVSSPIRQPCSDCLCGPPLIITFCCCAKCVQRGHVRMPMAYLLYGLLEVTLWLRFVYRGVDRWWCPHPGVQNLARPPRLEGGCDDMRKQW